MKFIIRDDDLNYFSTPADIERWYSDIFVQKIPVGFAMIPFVKPSSDVYPFLDPQTAPKVENKEYPIGENAELISYIKSNPLIEVLQHGCTHENIQGVFEYAQQSSGLIEATRRGKAELEKAFDHPVHMFAAPHDWINTDGVRGIEASKLDIVRGRGAGLRNWLWRWQYIAIFIQMLFYRFPKYISHAPPVYPYVLNFGKHKEVCSYRLEDTDVFEGLDYVHEKNGIFVVVTHIHFFNEEKKARLLKLIEKARSLGAEFVLPSGIFA
jgi:peptidoglycan/xylan/chitin deacetylase (PgdA/CDA1 family)